MSREALERFKQAQDQSFAGFAAALAELRAGAKRGHWIWYVFPQLAGLGRSATARQYALADVAEAIAYAEDPILCARLLEISTVVAAHLRQGVALASLLGSEIDALKLVSSMTLFEAVAEARAPAESADLRALAAVAREILAAAEAQGYPRCEHTLQQLRTRDASAASGAGADVLGRPWVRGEP